MFVWKGGSIKYKANWIGWNREAAEAYYLKGMLNVATPEIFIF